MVTISGLQLGLLQNLSASQSSFATSLERISTGSRLNSAADDPAGFSMANTLRAEIRGITAQLSNAALTGSMIGTASSAVSDQISILQDARELAVSAASSTATDRTSYQTSLDGRVSDFDVIANTTSFNGRNLLDGSFNQSSLSLGGVGSPTINVNFSSTQGTDIGQVADVSGSSVTTTALASGDLIINGVTIGASSSDGVSTASDDASAIAVANAINAANTGVTATALATELNLGSVSAGSFSDGDLTINGASIGAVNVQANDSDDALVTAINDVSSSTGVTASLNSANEIVLTAADGRNITTAGNDTDGTNVLGADPGSVTYTAGVALTSAEAITVSGGNPGSAGLSAGTTTVSTGSSVATLDISTQENAEAAIRQIDAAIAQLSAVQTEYAAAETRLDTITSSLTSTQTSLSSGLSQVADADIAAETANLAASSIQTQTQIALLAQSQVQQSFVLDLLAPISSFSTNRGL